MLPVAAQAQALVSGTWTGTVIPPNGELIEVTYTVHAADDSLSIMMHVPEMGDIPFRELHVTDDKLTCNWSVDTELMCEFDLKAGNQYEGTCTDIQGESGQVTMVPPKADTSEEQ